MENATVHSVELAGALCLRQAAETREKLRASIASHEAIDVHCTDLAEVDLSIVQILISAFRAADAAGKSLAVRFAAGSALDDILLRGGFIDDNGAPPARDAGLWVRINA